MTGWAPITDKIIDNGFGQSRSGGINGIVIHHVAGTNGRDYVANWNSRTSHPTYHIANNGTVTGIVHPDREPDSTQGGIDDEAITVEIDNSHIGGDWPVSDKALASLVSIIKWHGSESNRKGFALNRPGVGQSEFFIAWHQQYAQVECPGPYIIKHLGWIVEQAAEITKPAVATELQLIVEPIKTGEEIMNPIIIVQPKGAPQNAKYRVMADGSLRKVGRIENDGYRGVQAQQPDLVFYVDVDPKRLAEDLQ